MGTIITRSAGKEKAYAFSRQPHTKDEEWGIFVVQELHLGLHPLLRALTGLLVLPVSIGDGAGSSAIQLGSLKGGIMLHSHSFAGLCY